MDWAIPPDRPDAFPVRMSTHSPVTRVPSQVTGKYLTITLDNESYGIAVMKVREIIRMQKITPVPRMPEHVKGVLNLRGRVIPVVDLRLKFGLRAASGDTACIVVVQVKLPAMQSVQMGLIVDGVEEVVSLSSTEIEPIPDFGSSIDATCLIGLAKVKGQVKTLLDIERVLVPETADAQAWRV